MIIKAKMAKEAIVRTNNRPGALARVTITGGHPHHLSGRLVEVTARPRHRVRIPVASG